MAKMIIILIAKNCIKRNSIISLKIIPRAVMAITVVKVIVKISIIDAFTFTVAAECKRKIWEFEDKFTDITRGRKVKGANSISLEGCDICAFIAITGVTGREDWE